MFLKNLGKILCAARTINLLSLSKCSDYKHKMAGRVLFTSFNIIVINTVNTVISTVTYIYLTIHVLFLKTRNCFKKKYVLLFESPFDPVASHQRPPPCLSPWSLLTQCL